MVSRRGVADREEILSAVLSPEEAVRAATRASQAASRASARVAELVVDTAPTPEDTVSSGAVVVARLPWGHLLRVSAARALLTLVVTLVLWTLLPALMGWTPRVILSGSMEPRIHVGDVVVTRTVPAGVLATGQVVTVQDPDHPGRTRTHRVLRRGEDGTLVLKGDANAQADSSHVPLSTVLGVAVLRVPWVGRPAYWLSEQNWPALGGATALLGWCLVTAFPRARHPEAPGSGGDPGAGTRRPGRGRRVAAAAAIGAVVVGGVSDPAAAAYTRSAANPDSSLAAASNFYPYRTAVLADAPSLYWRLGETSGTSVADASGNNRGGTVTGSGSTWNQAGALPGESRETSLAVTGAMITAKASVAGPNPFSIEAWVRSTSTAGGRILGFGDGSGSSASTTTDRQLYLAPSGKAMFGLGNNKAIASTASVANGSWHHLVGTFDNGSSSMRLYVDGVLQGALTANPANLTGFWRAGGETLSGWTGNPTSSSLNGSLEDLAVYPTVLSAARVKAHHDAGVTP